MIREGIICILVRSICDISTDRETVKSIMKLASEHNVSINEENRGFEPATLLMYKQLVELGGYAVCEFYIRHNEFEATIMAVQSKSEEQIKVILDMAVIYLNVNDYRNKAKNIILTYKNVDADVEFPLAKMFYDKYVDAERDKVFLQEFMKTKVSRRLVRAFVRYLEESAVFVVDYADIIIQLCENVLKMEIKELRKQWGIENELSKLIISLYDKTANSSRMTEKQIADKCLNLWDIMFERQLGSVREISRQLMER